MNASSARLPLGKRGKGRKETAAHEARILFLFSPHPCCFSLQTAPSLQLAFSTLKIVGREGGKASVAHFDFSCSLFRDVGESLGVGESEEREREEKERERRKRERERERERGERVGGLAQLMADLFFSHRPENLRAHVEKLVEGRRGECESEHSGKKEKLKVQRDFREKLGFIFETLRLFLQSRPSFEKVHMSR